MAINIEYRLHFTEAQTLNQTEFSVFNCQYRLFGIFQYKEYRRRNLGIGIGC